MANDTSLPAGSILPLITAVIAFLDTEGAFGPSDPRTIRARAQLHTAVEKLTDAAQSWEPPRLHVLQGRRPDGGVVATKPCVMRRD